MAVNGELHLSFDADYGAYAASMPAIDRFLADHATPPRASYILQLALEELITNIVKYAFAPHAPDTIDVRVAQAGDALRIRIAYSGIPFDPVSLPEPTFAPTLQDRSAGGMGLHLVKHLVDHFAYRRSEEKNQLEFIVRLTD